MTRAERMTAAELDAAGIPAGEIVWADKVFIGAVEIGIAGQWATSPKRLSLLLSHSTHPLALPTLVIRLLTADPVVYINAPDAARQDYCRRGGGLLVADLRLLGPVYAVTRQRCPFWPGARDPDNFPDGDLQWKSRATPSRS